MSGDRSVGVFLPRQSREHVAGAERTLASAGVSRQRLFWFLFQVPRQFSDEFSEKVWIAVLAVM